MLSRLSRLAPEEIAGAVLLAAALIVVAVDPATVGRALGLEVTAGLRADPVRRVDGDLALERDAEDQRMRLVLALGRRWIPPGLAGPDGPSAR